MTRAPPSRPITPVARARHAIGAGLTGAFANDVPRTLVVTGGSIPATATAVTGNLTVTGQTGGGYLAVTKTPTRDARHLDPQLPAR